jgi:TM2 domain-containing membrane protein YozV
MITALPPSAYAWSDEQRTLYYAHMSAWQKDEVVGLLLALFLGTFGAHHFYLRRPGLGILYCCFCWTGIPNVVSFIECFFMPGRVRQYNLALATYFASSLGAPTVVINAPSVSGIVRTCAHCGTSLIAGSNYCGRCGAKVG